MTIDELKTTEEVRNYCEKVGYENLTDDDVKNLCLKLYNIAYAE